jgi:hypothetical protein
MQEIGAARTALTHPWLCLVPQDELRNAFHLACIKGNVELIEMILDRSFAHLNPKP